MHEGETDGDEASPRSGLSARLVRWSPALKHDYFRWYLFGHLLSVIGGWMQDASLRWYVQILTADVGSEKWLGWTAAAASLPIIVFSPLGGTLADRLPKRLVIAATQSVDMMIAFTLGLLVWYDALPMAGVFVFAALHGSFLAFDIPARQAYVIEMVGPKDLMSAIGMNSTIFNMGRLLGPMMAGLVMGSSTTIAAYMAPRLSDENTAKVGIAICFFLNGLSFLGLIGVLLFMPRPAASLQGNGDEARARGNVDLLGGFRSVWERPHAFGLMLTLVVFLLAGGSYPTLLPALADYQLRTDERGYSMLLTANGLGSVMGALVVASLHQARSRRIPIVGGLALVALGLLFVSVSTKLVFACMAIFLAGAGVIMFLASANSTIQLSVPNEYRGRVMSIWVLTFGLGMPVGSILAGQLAAVLGTRSMLLLQGVGTLPAIFLAAMILGKHEKTLVAKEGERDGT